METAIKAVQISNLKTKTHLQEPFHVSWKTFEGNLTQDISVPTPRSCSSGVTSASSQHQDTAAPSGTAPESSASGANQLTSWPLTSQWLMWDHPCSPRNSTHVGVYLSYLANAVSPTLTRLWLRSPVPQRCRADVTEHWMTLARSIFTSHRSSWSGTVTRSLMEEVLVVTSVSEHVSFIFTSAAAFVLPVLIDTSRVSMIFWPCGRLVVPELLMTPQIVASKVAFVCLFFWPVLLFWTSNDPLH